MNKQQKIEALQNLINGKLTPGELIKSLPQPMAIVWSETDETQNVYIVNHQLSTKAEFEKANKLRAKYHG